MTIDSIKIIIFSKESKKLIQKIFHSPNNEENYFSWKNKFRSIHGDFDKQKQVDLEGLSKLYELNIHSTDDLFRLIYSLENYYIWFLRQIIYVRIAKTLTNFEIKYGFKDNFFQSHGLSAFATDKALLFVETTSNIDVVNIAESIFNTQLLNWDYASDFDYIREIYQVIFDKRIRHSMGEFFTPDWLAEFVITTTIDNDDTKNKKFIDPTCGTGTFIVQVINKLKYISEGNIFNLVYGMDINPVSVLASKANYLLLYLDYYGNLPVDELILPIYETNIIQNKPDEVPMVDYIIGNPPWVNWEYLPNNYKENTKFAWQEYELYSGKGLDANFLKEDISCLITYVALDKYLTENGRLGFLLKESLLKSSRQAKPFRNFHIKSKNIPLKINKVVDLANIKPFEGINPRCIALFIEKNKKTEYPINYLVWRNKEKKKTFNMYSRFEDISDKITFEKILAEPIDKDDLTSSWKTLSKEYLELSNNISGKSEYRARTGVFAGGGNAVFWLQINDKNDDNTVEVENLIERAKNKVEKVKMTIEDDYVFPLLVGRDISFWSYTYSKYIICPHTQESKMYPINKKILCELPHTEKYFKYFKQDLEKRKGFTGLDKHIQKDYYYALQRIGEYTFKKYKVSWKYISKTFCPVVIENIEDKYLGTKNIIPNEKVIYIGLSSKDEAYYLCGLLSSDIFRMTIESFMIGTQITPSIINNLNIEKYDDKDIIHKEISKLCLQGHENHAEYQVYLDKINKLVYQKFK